MGSGALTLIVLLALAVMLAAVAVRSPRWRRRLPQLAGLTAGSVLAAYLVGRGIAEFFLVHYANPASYRNDWGGPSLAGVLAVHSGPGLAILAGTAAYLLRRHRRPAGRPAGRGPATRDNAGAPLHPRPKQEVR
jgi:hypothetical protein